MAAKFTLLENMNAIEVELSPHYCFSKALFKCLEELVDFLFVL